MKGLVPEDEIVAESLSETKKLRSMIDDAREYITGFQWCPKQVRFYLAFGVGGVVAVTLAQFDRKIAGIDDRLWVIVGDLPSAYLVVEHQDSARDALSRYCDMMDDWVLAVESSTGFEKVFPVTAPRTKENSELLSRRVRMLRSDILQLMSL